MSAALRIQLMLLARRNHFGKKSDPASLHTLHCRDAQYAGNAVHTLSKDFESIRLQDHAKNPAIVKATSAENEGAKVVPGKVDLNEPVSHPEPGPAARPIAQEAFK